MSAPTIRTAAITATSFFAKTLNPLPETRDIRRWRSLVSPLMPLYICPGAHSRSLEVSVRILMEGLAAFGVIRSPDGPSPQAAPPAGGGYDHPLSRSAQTDPELEPAGGAAGRQAIVPERPTLEGLEHKWSDAWERDGSYRFDRS